MILSKNELDSQNLEEFEELLQEYKKISPKYFMEIGSMYGWSLQHFIHYGKDESTAVKVQNILGDNKLDFLFIDGDHRYEAIKSDYEMYSPLVREGGVIGFHDIGEREEGGGRRFWLEIKDKFEYKEILKDVQMVQ